MWLLIIFLLVSISAVFGKEYIAGDDGTLYKAVTEQSAIAQCSGIQQSIDQYQAKIDELAMQKADCQAVIDEVNQIKIELAKPKSVNWSDIEGL